MWPGDPARSDARTIPDLSYMHADGARTLHNYLLADYRADILVDNLMDLSHADYLHDGSFSGGPPRDSAMTVREEGDEVVVDRRLYGAPAAPRQRGVAATIDTGFLIRWRPGQVITFQSRTVPTGGDIDAATPVRFAHIATPATAHRTHYFMSITRGADDPDSADRDVAAHQRRVIETEDGPMLEAIDRDMAGADLMALRPLVLPSDVGGLRVRAVMRRLLAGEAEVAAAA